MGKCTFNILWMENPEYRDWLRKCEGDRNKAKCGICVKVIDLSRMGESAVKSHARSEWHKAAMKLSSSSQTITSMGVLKSNSESHSTSTPTSSMSSDEHRNTKSNRPQTQSASSSSSMMKSFVLPDHVLTAENSEILWTLYTVASRSSYSANESVGKLFKIMFPDSSIANRFSYGERKSAYLCVFGIAAHLKKKLLSEIKGRYVILFDESLNHKIHQKQMDIHVRYLCENTTTKRQVTTRFLDFCIACDKPNENVTCQHPFHEGGLCLDCKERFIENLFAVGDDSIYVYCTLCQNGGQLFVCESMTCQRVYCLPCIDLFINKNAIERVKMTDPWFCFECTQYTEETHGLIIPKDEWQQNVIRLYDTGYRIQPPDLSYFLTGKKAMRVLSLFDGIGTAKLALNELNIAVESFFSSEVDADALLVSSVNHGIDIIQIGDITKLTDAQINRICPIDLVIGGSPCNEFSIANPARKAFDMDTTGVLFFDFCRVLEIVQRRNKERYVFWLYENVASMKSVVREVFNRFLGCEPALWDAKYFSAQSRARFFWGNIPGMYSTPDLRQLASPASLNTVLSPYCHRRATVERLRCVTTRSNSLRLGKDDKGFPIKMNGKECSIWIPELERLFGFPAHYTDVANLPTTRRQKLLGRAWSVPVIKHLLTPLKHYFASRKPE